VEVDAVGAHLREQMDQLHGRQDGSHGLAERVAARIAYRPEAERELVLRPRLKRIAHGVLLSTTSSGVVAVVFELVPTIRSNRPGSTTRFICSSVKRRAAGPTLKVTV